MVAGGFNPRYFQARKVRGVSSLAREEKRKRSGNSRCELGLFLSGTESYEVGFRGIGNFVTLHPISLFTVI